MVGCSHDQFVLGDQNEDALLKRNVVFRQKVIG